MSNVYEGNPTNPNIVTGNPPGAGVEFKLNIPADTDPNNASTMFNGQYSNIADQLQFLTDGYNIIYDGLTTVKGLYIDGVGGQPIPNPPTTIANAIFFDGNGSTTGASIGSAFGTLLIQNYDPSGDILLNAKGGDIDIRLNSTATNSILKLQMDSASQTIQFFGPSTSNIFTMGANGDCEFQGNILGEEMVLDGYLHALTLGIGTNTAAVISGTTGGIITSGSILSTTSIKATTSLEATTTVTAGTGITATNGSIISNQGDVVALVHDVRTPAGNVQTNHIIGLSAAPTLSSIDSRIDAAITGTDLAFSVSITVHAMSSITDEAVLFVVNFHTAFNTAPFIVSCNQFTTTITPSDIPAASQIVAGYGTSNFEFTSRGTVATLYAGITYKWNFIAIQ